MAPIARIAQVQLPGVVGIEKLRMPKTRINAEQLAAVARGMATAAAPYASTFIAAGVPADFATQLNSVSDTMLGFRTNRAQSIGRVTGATKQFKSGLTDARRVVHAIDALVKSALKEDPTLARLLEPGEARAQHARPEHVRGHRAHTGGTHHRPGDRRGRTSIHRSSMTDASSSRPIPACAPTYRHKTHGSCNISLTV